VVLGDKVFATNKAGVLTAGNLKTGERLWQTRLKGPFSATHVVTATHLYCVNEAGLLQIVDTRGKEGEITGTLNLDDQILGSPAVGGGAIYVRSNAKIYKISE
jgi:outer membrane protein assembly factor BamB